MITPLLMFDIRNNFSELGQAFYSHGPTARAAGNFELYRDHEPDNEHQVCVILYA